MVLQPVVNSVRSTTRGPKAVTVASRYGQQKPTSGCMPTLKSQLETARADLARSQAAEEAASRKAAENVASARLMRSMLGAELGVADAQLGAAATAGHEWCRQACRLGAKLEAAAGREAQLRAECARNAHLSASLDAARESIDALQAETLPGMAREIEAQRARADRAEAQAAVLRERVSARDATLREQAAHFERLSSALGAAGGSEGLSALTRRALGSFGLLYSEKGLHSDPRFSSLQDHLVQLCMATDSLTEWMPWFVATREAEARQLAHLAESEAAQEGEAAARRFCGALSPGAWSARRPAARSRVDGVGGVPAPLDNLYGQ
eukprot:scaffold7146_cov115-Isochrysis_galbana.AAC.2